MKTMSSKAWLIAGAVLLPLVSSGCSNDKEALQSQNQQLQAQNQQLQGQNRQLQSQNQQLASQNQQLDAQVGRLQHAVAYTVNSDLLFRSGRWDMTDRGKEIISRLSRKLAPTQQDKLLVSGYTDDVPIGPGLKEAGVTSNDELSQKRADAVMQFLVSQGVRREMVSAHGFGESDPVAPNDTAQGRAQNRRVVLSVGGMPATAEGSSRAQ